MKKSIKVVVALGIIIMIGTISAVLLLVPKDNYRIRQHTPITADGYIYYNIDNISKKDIRVKFCYISEDGEKQELLEIKDAAVNGFFQKDNCLYIYGRIGNQIYTNEANGYTEVIYNYLKMDMIGITHFEDDKTIPLALLSTTFISAAELGYDTIKSNIVAEDSSYFLINGNTLEQVDSSTRQTMHSLDFKDEITDANLFLSSDGYLYLYITTNSYTKIVVVDPQKNLYVLKENKLIVSPHSITHGTKNTIVIRENTPYFMNNNLQIEEIPIEDSGISLKGIVYNPSTQRFLLFSDNGILAISDNNLFDQQYIKFSAPIVDDFIDLQAIQSSGQK